MVIAADGVLFCEGLRALIEAEGHFHVARQTHDGAYAIRLTNELRPDVLVLDAEMPRFPDSSALRDLAGGRPPTGLLLIAASLAGSTFSLAAEIGARGLVLKSARAVVLLAAVRAVADGEGWLDREIVPDFPASLRQRCPWATTRFSQRVRDFSLTARERDVVEQVAAASSNKSIALRFGISETTVKHHLTSIFGKMGVSSRLELARLALNADPQTGNAGAAPRRQTGDSLRRRGDTWLKT